MKKEKIFQVFEHLTEAGKRAFLWKSERTEVPGFQSFVSPEGNGIRSEATSVVYDPQYSSVYAASKGTIQVDSQLAPGRVNSIHIADVPIVVVTHDDVISVLAPMFKRRSEMMDWMRLVGEYVSLREAAGNPVAWYWESDMLELARYLYENCADSIADQSIYDKYVL